MILFFVILVDVILKIFLESLDVKNNCVRYCLGFAFKLCADRIIS